jgi:hypothetical protein
MISVTLFKDGKRLGILDHVPEDIQAIVWGGTIFIRHALDAAAFHSVESYHTNRDLKP